MVGDTLYGAPARIAGLAPGDEGKDGPTLPRNFLHAASLKLAHPITGKPLDLEAPLPEELTDLLKRLRALELPKANSKPTLHEDW